MARTVKPGGFGDPEGVLPSASSTRADLPRVGSFELAAGNGHGGGRPGGVVGASGFGDAAATAGAGGNGTAHGAVRSGGFGDAAPDAPSSAGRVRTSAAAEYKPVEILFKPKPVYTEQARSAKVEGQVLLEVVFAASGDIRVERVVRGLEYGLNDAAKAAAMKIRFHPAMRNGAPVDTKATVNITFALT